MDINVFLPMNISVVSVILFQNLPTLFLLSVDIVSAFSAMVIATVTTIAMTAVIHIRYSWRTGRLSSRRNVWPGGMSLLNGNISEQSSSNSHSAA